MKANSDQRLMTMPRAEMKGAMLTASLADVPFKFTMQDGKGQKGEIILDKDGADFQGNHTASAALFVQEIVKVYAPQWRAAQERIRELEAQVKQLQEQIANG